MAWCAVIDQTVGLVGMNKINERAVYLLIPLFFYSTSEGTVVGAGDSGVNRTGEVFVLLEIQNQVNK